MSLEMFTFRWSTTSSPPSSRLFYLASFLSRPSHHKYSRRLLFFFPPAVQFWRCRRFLLAQPGATSAFGDDDRNNKLSSTLSISKKRGRKRLLSRFSSNLIGALDADVKAWTTLRDARKKRRRRLFLSGSLSSSGQEKTDWRSYCQSAGLLRYRRGYEQTDLDRSVPREVSAGAARPDHTQRLASPSLLFSADLWLLVVSWEWFYQKW